MRFWRNVILIGLAHAALVVGLVRWGGMLGKLPSTSVVWMAATTGAPGAALAQTPSPPPEEEEAATPGPSAEERPAPAATPVENEIPLPTATPAPSPRPTPTATAKPKVTPTPKPKKTMSPKPKSEKKPKKKTSPAPTATPAKKESPGKKTATVAVNPVKAGASGSSTTGRGAADAGQFNWYGKMLHDRFFGAWAQPTTAAAMGGQMAALVQVRIEKDGRVSDFRIVRSSGNVVVDESIAAVGQRVMKVDALPAGLAADGHYDVRIKFELDVE